jgi:hypothetical protein
MATRAKLNLTPALTESAVLGNAGTQESEPRPDRIGKRIIAGHFPKSTWATLRRLCVALDKTNQDLLEEALTDLFAKHRHEIK